MTEPTGWIVSVTEVRAAGRRGSETVISSQPSTCEVSASRSSQACARPARHEVGLADRERRRRRATTAATAVASNSGPAGRRRSLAALAQHEDEAGVGDAGQEAEQHAARGWSP